MPLLLAVLLCWSIPSFGETILIQSPDASEADYRLYLESHPEILSVASFFAQKAKRNHLQETQLMQLGALQIQDLNLNLNKIIELQAAGPLSLHSLRFLQDYTEKMLQKQITLAQRQTLLSFYCKSFLLLQEGGQTFSCERKSIDLSQLKQKYPFTESVVIESRNFLPHETIVLTAKTKYQWNLLSNSKKPITFYGTFDEILEQNFAFENLIEGSCSAFTAMNFDLNLELNYKIYFSNSCIVRKDTLSEISFYEKNKPWIATLGVLLLGGIVYSLKDKTLVFKTANGL